MNESILTQTTPEESPRFFTLDELNERCSRNPTQYIVEGLLPADDVHVAVGDSGLGKTPWAYQLGLCVASGKSFLGHNVKQGRVLYYDLENGQEEIVGVGRAICGCLDIGFAPTDFRVFCGDTANLTDLEGAIDKYAPSLVIVDTLRAFDPHAEGKNEDMASFIRKIKRIARKCHCAILLLHHVRKPGEHPPNLETAPTMEWLLQACGARALVNQTNTRIALDTPRLMSHGADAALIMKVFVKIRGEIGPYYLERVLVQGDPVGYRRITGSALLGNAEQEAAFGRLPLPPKQFTFGEAKAVYAKTDNPTSQWLKKCQATGLIRKVSRGYYERITTSIVDNGDARQGGEVPEAFKQSLPSVQDAPSVELEEALKNHGSG